MSAEEARRAAEERFGDADGIEDELRQQARRLRARQGRRMTMAGLRQDLGYALRTLRRSPGFTTVAVVTLALALGGNTAIFSVVDAALLQALPFEDHEELVFLNGYHLVDGQPSIRGASYPEFRDWRERSRGVRPTAAVDGVSLALTGDGGAERVAAEMVTVDYFEVLGVEPLRGRTFRADEHAEPDAHPVAVISHELFERRFALDPSLPGRDLVLNDRPLTVIGVMPEGFGGINLNTDVWIPEAMISLTASIDRLDARGSRSLTVIGRLAGTTDPATAQAELDVIASDLQAAYPRLHEDRFAQVQPFRDGYLGTTGGLLWVLLGAGGVLLLIAAANVANLLLVRSHHRTRELVLRRALGAGGRRVAYQLVTESTVLATLGGLAGIALAAWGLRALGPMIPAGVLPGYVEPRMSLAALAYSLIVLAVVGVVTGLAPALASARDDIASALREGARSASGSPRRLRAQHVFVVAQISLALVLMVGAGLLTRSFRAQLAVDPGAELDGVLALRVQLPRARYDDNDVIWRFASELERRLLSVPGVQGASISSDLPFRGGSSASYIYKEGTGSEDGIRYHRHFVTAGYFETLGVDRLRGRYLTAEDRDGTPGVMVITDAMARRVYPGESPVGKIMSLASDGSMPAVIVGVVEDVRYRNLTTSLMADANSPDVFFSFWQIPTRSLEVAVRAAGDPVALASTVRTAVGEIDPDLPVYRVQPLRDAHRAQTATPRFAAFLMGLFSALAGLLAGVGIYGVLAFAVGQRSREIAIRRAVGASARSVARAVVGEGVKLAGIGLGLGALGALFATRVLEGFLFGVTAGDPTTFAGVGAAVVVAALLAAVVPALRATKRDPAEALNTE